ncbi:MAG: hypothetical protein GQ560_00395 [Dehalococcoidia bacterium]|nr:hypothetical protein [Dehalococcoidia bacterium]
MIIDLTDERALDSALTGGKASELAKLISKTFPVPPGFVITTRAFMAFLEETGLEAEINAFPYQSAETTTDVLTQFTLSIQDRIRSFRLPEAISNELEKRLIEFQGEFVTDLLWAVRSSAIAEDLPGASFAGQYDTYLGLAGIDEVADAVIKCWASFFNAHSLQYRRDHNIDDFGGAVIVQRLIRSDAAGVCFTLDPVTGDIDNVVITSNFGLGESVVSGRVTPDMFVVQKKSREVIHRHVSNKEIKVLPAPGGAKEVAIDESSRQQSSLTDDQAIAIARLAAEIEEMEKHPVDVEWAIFDGNVYILQSRPITALPSITQPSTGAPPDGWAPESNTPIDPRYPLYSNGNISEILPGCITPLSWSYIGPTIEHAFRSQGIALGVMEESGPEYQVLGFFYHRPYMCVSFMEEAAAHTPGISPDTLHEEFIGPPDTKTPPLHLSDLRPDRWPAIVRVVLSIIRKTKSLSSDTQKCEETINRQREESTPEALKDWTDDRLIEGVSFSKAMAWVSDVHIWASTFAVLYFDLLRKQTRAWLDDDNGSLAAQMVTGIGTLPSANPAFSLYDLANTVLSIPEVSEHFASIGDNQRLLEALTADVRAKGFLIALEEFLTLHGHRAVCEAEFRRPSWREDPTQVISLIRNYLQPGVTPPEEIRIRQERVRDESTRRVDTLSPPKRFIAGRTREAARRNIELRERLKDLIVLRSDRFRRIYAEIRARLMARGLLYDPDDLFFLMWKEVRDLLTGKLSTEVAKEIISRRRQDFEWCQMLHVPKIINGKAIVVKPDEFPSEQQLQGMGVSPGKVEGRARVILDPRLESHIEPGEILIAPVTDAGWTPLFINAGGLIVDIGGLLSHGSIVAREYGLPAVVGVADATRRIKTGERIYLDGSTGVIIKLD